MRAAEQVADRLRDRPPSIATIRSLDGANPQMVG
jgi:hypothetical protein